MSIYQTIVCDRCGTEKKREDINSWGGWHEEASVELRGIARLYSGWPNFKWSGALCGSCADEVDAGVRSLFASVPLSNQGSEE